MTKIEIACCTIEKIDDRILVSIYRDRYVVKLKDAKEVTAAFEKFYPEGPVYTLVNLNKKFLNSSIPALQYFASQAAIIPRIKGNAVILSNLPTRIMVRFFIKSFKPKYPTKIFANKESALEWLHSLKAQNEKLKL